VSFFVPHYPETQVPAYCQGLPATGFAEDAMPSMQTAGRANGCPRIGVTDLMIRVGSYRSLPSQPSRLDEANQRLDGASALAAF
jgi:hypothetical protein